MDAASGYIVFVDESGDHGLRTINPQYPVFVLSCCIFEKRQYVERICPAVQRFKLRWWPHDAVILHSSQIRRQQPPFAFLTQLETRERFMIDLADTLTEAPFRVVASSVHKCRLRDALPHVTDVYSLALRFCIENVVTFLYANQHQDGEVPFLIERRGKVEDQQLVSACRRICDGENRWGRLANLSMELVDKKANLAGLQIADLVSTPIGRHLLKPDEPNRAFEVVREKLWLPPPLHGGSGVLETYP